MHNRIITFEQFCINVNETVARMLNVSVDSAIDIITDQRIDMEGEYFCSSSVYELSESIVDVFNYWNKTN